MPSGIITISAVPMRRPVPTAEMSRICRWDRENDRGRDPDRNELFNRISWVTYSEDNCIRQSHEAAQEEQHAQAVPHDCDGNEW